MALHRYPALLGLQRSLRRMRRLLSWALARSPRPRSRARERLARLREAGLFRLLYGMTSGPSAPW